MIREEFETKEFPQSTNIFMRRLLNFFAILAMLLTVFLFLNIVLGIGERFNLLEYIALISTMSACYGMGLSHKSHWKKVILNSRTSQYQSTWKNFLELLFLVMMIGYGMGAIFIGLFYMLFSVLNNISGINILAGFFAMIIGIILTVVAAIISKTR